MELIVVVVLKNANFKGERINAKPAILISVIFVIIKKDHINVRSAKFN